MREPIISKKIEKANLSALSYEYKISDFEFINDDCQKKFINIEFNGCVFRKMNFSGSFNDCFLYHLYFENCDLSNVTFKKCGFHRVIFNNCRLMGTNFIECNLKYVTISDTKADYLNISGSKLNEVYFMDSMLENSFFDDTSLNKHKFLNCDLISASFIHTSLKDVDLSNSQIGFLKIATKDLKGAIISPYQAIDLMGIIGVKIKEE